MLNNVLFPAPFGPNKDTSSPGYTLIEIFFKIDLPLKDLLIFLVSNIGEAF